MKKTPLIKVSLYVVKVMHETKSIGDFKLRTLC